MMRPILPPRHAVCGFPVWPGCHRPLVGVDVPVRQKVKLRIEQLPVQFIQRQAAPAAFTEDTQHRFGALHFAYPFSIRISSHLVPFALRTAFPSPLVRRYSHDYYDTCVAIGLAPLRRSHVRPCHTC
jgi:hypothetical protein